MASYRDLIVWQKAIALGVAAYRLAERLPRHEHRGMVSQIRRAAASVSANIAEGNGRSHRADYLRFLAIAHGSLTELDSHLRLAVAVGYVTDEEVEGSLALCAETGRMLGGLMRALRSSPRSTRMCGPIQGNRPPTPAPPPTS